MDLVLPMAEVTWLQDVLPEVEADFFLLDLVDGFFSLSMVDLDCLKLEIKMKLSQPNSTSTGVGA